MLNKRQLQTLRDTKPTTGNRIRIAKQLAGTTQVEIAKATGYPQPYVSAVEAGDYAKIPLETARRFAQFFGATIEDLFPAQEVLS